MIRAISSSLVSLLGRLFSGGPIRIVRGLFAAGMVALAAGQVIAHDRERPELDGWYHSLKSKEGAWCCDGSDATHLADVDWESKDGSYRVRIDGQWIDVPKGAVIDSANRDGRALVWPYYTDGRTNIRCFMPGVMT